MIANEEILACNANASLFEYRLGVITTEFHNSLRKWLVQVLYVVNWDCSPNSSHFSL